jgi:outer membrane protein TolC
MPDPRFTYGYFVESVQTRTGPQKHKIGISQTFPGSGKLSLREKMALHEADAMYQEYVQARLKLIQEIRSAFHEYGYLHEAIRVSRQHMNLLKGMESVASLRFSSGNASQNALIQIQVEQGKLEDRIIELEALRKPLSSNLIAAVGSGETGLLPWPDKGESELLQIQQNALKNQLSELNPMLKKLRSLGKGADSAVRLAERNFRPDLTFGLEFIDVDGGRDPMIAMISFNLPVHRAPLQAARREAVKRRESIDENITEQQNRLQGRLDLAIHYFHDALRKNSLYRKTLVPKAQQAIEVALRGFESGVVSFAELLDAERTLLEFQLMAQRQIANAHKYLAEIDSIAGNDMIMNSGTVNSEQ